MADNQDSNQQIDTNQPKVLRGLVLRGVKTNKTVKCEGLDGNGCVVRIEDYDKKLHGPKADSEKLPTRVSKKASKKKAAKKSK